MTEQALRLYASGCPEGQRQIAFALFGFESSMCS